MSTGRGLVQYATAPQRGARVLYLCTEPSGGDSATIVSPQVDETCVLGGHYLEVTETRGEQ